jgi:polyphosphate kinase 2
MPTTQTPSLTSRNDRLIPKPVTRAIPRLDRQRKTRTQRHAPSTNGAALAKKGARAPEPMKRKQYDKEMKKLQGDLVKVQLWAKHTGAKIVVIFEGRDAAGKGGVIKAITERTSPRSYRIAALPAPTDREKTQMYMQRYMAHMPAGGEIVLFDRSWYNRAGVESVLGFATPKQVKRFLQQVPLMERAIIQSGIVLIKYWFEVSQDEQTARFKDRIKDPRKIWKLSPMDLESHRRWYDFSRARDAMFKATDTRESPWHVVKSDDKFRARLNCISHMLKLIPYQDVPREKIKLPKRQKPKGYTEPRYPWRYIPSKY